MSFAGKVWRLLVGIKDALALMFLLLFFLVLFAALSARPSPALVREGALLIELDGTVVEEVSKVDALQAILSQSVPTREHAARDLVRAIDAAAKDKRIKAIALDMTRFLGGGHVHMQDLAGALDRFRAAKKPVYAYAVAYSDDAMMLAAHSTEVWVDPLGGIALTGPGGENLYFAGLLERFQVKAHVFRVGTYKSAVEPFILDQMSPEARENAQALYGALWTEWQANVKRARPQADIARVTGSIPAWLAASNGDLAKASVEAGLADRIGSREEWGTRIAKAVGNDPLDKSPGAFAHTGLGPWLAANKPEAPHRGLTGGGTVGIGVVTIAGEISDGKAGPGEAGAERIVKLLDDALDDNLKALVVRVDSPGGTVTGSEEIRRAILRHKAKNIPVVVSMGNVAASGGYWIATAGERIFAEPETITGSIGIFGVIPTFEDTLSQYGVTTDGVRTTPLSGQPDLAAGFTPETEAVLQATVESGYERFLGLVAQSRRLTRDRADQLGQGRVWDGGSARQLGLVDEFGGLDDALAYAAKRAKLKDGAWTAVHLDNPPDPFAQIVAGMMQDQSGSDSPDVMALLSRQQASIMARLVGDLDRLVKVQGMQARCLECPAAPRPVPGAHAGQGPVLQLLARFLGS